MRSVQLRQLEHFEAVYRLRSFTRAARELYLSQSALSRSIQALEADLGQTLFDRSTQAVDRLVGHFDEIAIYYFLQYHLLLH